MENEVKQRNQRNRRRERAQRMQAQRESKVKDGDSGEDESPTREKPPRPPARRKKSREPLGEEDIIDGFAIMAFRTYEDLEVSTESSEIEQLTVDGRACRRIAEPFSASELQPRSPTKCKFGLSGFRSFVLIYRAVLEWQYVVYVEVSYVHNKTTFPAIVLNYGDRLAVCGSLERRARIL
ncbi:hypothetical protein SFRURICE_002486 [Spodoptera frugiperda]|nr:hypothetical protein SFRURICE_002486 [Spodoptera frugiperda]